MLAKPRGKREGGEIRHVQLPVCDEQRLALLPHAQRCETRSIVMRCWSSTKRAASLVSGMENAYVLWARNVWFAVLSDFIDSTPLSVHRNTAIVDQVPRYSAYVGMLGEFFTPGSRHEINVSSETRRQAGKASTQKAHGEGWLEPVNVVLIALSTIASEHLVAYDRQHRAARRRAGDKSVCVPASRS